MIIQGEETEEQVCPPLFGFASSDDAEQLDIIADEVLGPGEDAATPVARSASPPCPLAWQSLCVAVPLHAALLQSFSTAAGPAGVECMQGSCIHRVSAPGGLEEVLFTYLRQCLRVWPVAHHNSMQA